LSSSNVKKKKNQIKYRGLKSKLAPTFEVVVGWVICRRGADFVGILSFG